MSDELKIRVGGDLRDDLAGFVAAWKRGLSGDTQTERTITFQSWDALSSVLTGERYRLLRHVHGNPAPSVNALATALKRQYRRVHEDVTLLERAGLLDRSSGEVKAVADRLTAEIVL